MWGNFSPLAILAEGQIEKEHRLLGSEPQVFETQQVSKQGPPECVRELKCRPIRPSPLTRFLENEHRRGRFRHGDISGSDTVSTRCRFAPRLERYFGDATEKNPEFGEG